MPKPDPALLDASRYPYTCRIEPRFSDLDVNMHINNVAVAKFFEDARVRFHYAIGYRTRTDDVKTMIASLAIEYLGEGAYPDPVDMHVAFAHVCRTSLSMAMLADQGGRPIAFSRSVLVRAGPNGAVPLPEDFPSICAGWMLRS